MIIKNNNSINYTNTHNDFSYYEYIRTDILTHIPKDVKCILSVRCGSGSTELELIKRGVKVVGIEIDHKAAEAARKRGLIVLEGNASTVDISQVSESFDCLVYADVLEHLPNPVAVLKHHVENLQSNGTVIISVPNFRHYLVFWQLFVRGHIQYEDAGILDHTHLRITTRKMVLEWFDQVGLELSACRCIIWGRRYKLISACLFGLAKEFISSQIICVGRKL